MVYSFINKYVIRKPSLSDNISTRGQRWSLKLGFPITYSVINKRLVILYIFYFTLITLSLIKTIQSNSLSEQRSVERVKRVRYFRIRFPRIRTVSTTFRRLVSYSDNYG